MDLASLGARALRSLALASLVLLPATAHAACLGDCDGDGRVTIDELVTAVGVALGSQPPRACPAAAGAGGEVTIAELVGAVANALNGCPAEPTPTATPEFSIVDLGTIFGAPGGQTAVALSFRAALTIGVIELEYRFSAGIMEAIGDCSVLTLPNLVVRSRREGDAFLVNVLSPNVPVTIPADAQLECQFQVSESAKAGDSTASLTGRVTLFDGETVPLSATAQVTLSCLIDAHCGPGQVCVEGVCGGSGSDF